MKRYKLTETACRALLAFNQACIILRELDIDYDDIKLPDNLELIDALNDLKENDDTFDAKALRQTIFDLEYSGGVSDLLKAKIIEKV